MTTTKKDKLPHLDSLLKAGADFQKAKVRLVPHKTKVPKLPKGALPAADPPSGLDRLASIARAAAEAKAKPVARKGRKK